MKNFLHGFALLSTICLGQCTPTMTEVKDFDAKKDVDAIHVALDTAQVDIRVVGDIIGNRACSQRMEISRTYLVTFHQYVIEPIAARLQGSYAQLLKDSFVCGEMISAVHLKRALKEKWTKPIIEVMVVSTQSDESRAKLKDTYQKIFQRAYEDDIKKQLEGDFENVLLEMTWRVRQGKQPTDENKARDTATQLNDEIHRWKNHRNLLDGTLMETSFEQLILVFQKFKEVNGQELEKVIEERFDGDKRAVYLDLIYFCRTSSSNFVEYFSNRLHEAVDKNNRDDQTMIRNILIHSETDLQEIKADFQKRYQKNLVDEIGDDKAGPFEQLLKKFVIGNAK